MKSGARILANMGGRKEKSNNGGISNNAEDDDNCIDNGGKEEGDKKSYFTYNDNCEQGRKSTGKEDEYNNYSFDVNDYKKRGIKIERRKKQIFIKKKKSREI
jgi:hypothetical protein